MRRTTAFHWTDLIVVPLALAIAWSRADGAPGAAPPVLLKWSAPASPVTAPPVLLPWAAPAPLGLVVPGHSPPTMLIPTQWTARPAPIPTEWTARPLLVPFEAKSAED